MKQTIIPRAQFLADVCKLLFLKHHAIHPALSMLAMLTKVALALPVHSVLLTAKKDSTDQT